jgi:SAM-dependent methyltransferase
LRGRPGVSIADFRVADAQNLPLTDSSFDVAAMALVITFLPDPGKAVAEMRPVVRPGGWVASYMWDIPGGGVPVHPIYVAMESMGIASGRPAYSAASARDAMQRFWQEAELDSVETRTISISTVYSNFDDFWDSNAVPIGPQGKIIAGMTASAKEELRVHLRDQLPVAPDGRIVYQAFANAVKGRVPA